MQKFRSIFVSLVAMLACIGVLVGYAQPALADTRIVHNFTLDRAKIPLRQGSSTYGLTHIEQKHGSNSYMDECIQLAFNYVDYTGSGNATDSKVYRATYITGGSVEGVEHHVYIVVGYNKFSDGYIAGIITAYTGGSSTSEPSGASKWEDCAKGI